MSDFITSALLSSVAGVTHGFGKRAQPVPKPFQAAWERRPTKTQVHGTACAEVIAESQRCGEVDSLFTSTPGLLVPIMTADCVPILMSRRDGKFVAGTHSGWRGTRAGALRSLWEKLRTLGEDPRQWVAAIGPSIGPCCYEVSPELAREFEREFSSHGEGLAVPAPRRLDLPAINRAELERLGLGDVEVIRACTHCALDQRGEPMFHSFRREAGNTRQWSVISIKG